MTHFFETRVPELIAPDKNALDILELFPKGFRGFPTK